MSRRQVDDTEAHRREIARAERRRDVWAHCPDGTLSRPSALLLAERHGVTVSTIYRDLDRVRTNPRDVDRQVVLGWVLREMGDCYARAREQEDFTGAALIAYRISRILRLDRLFGDDDATQIVEAVDRLISERRDIIDAISTPVDSPDVQPHPG